MTVIAWCARMEALKTSLGWSEEATFCNATAALFGNVPKVMDSWAILHAEYAKTWAYLKTAMIKHYCIMQDSRSYIEAMFNIRPRTSNTDNMDAFMGEVMQAFHVVQETLPQPDK